MRKITVVRSVHTANGLCNVEELLELLRATEPEVIFSESRFSELDYHYRPGRLEATAITRLREFRLFQTVPVDNYDLPTNLLLELKRDVDRVLECVIKTSQEYVLLNLENDSNVCHGGFRYLNSVDCERMMARIAEVEENTIVGTCNQELIAALGRWRSLSQRRELEMVRNIYAYCRVNVFETGVFVVGAAHKAGIVREIESYDGSKADLINWNFAYAGTTP
jgi:hypothetical protein